MQQTILLTPHTDNMINVFNMNATTALSLSDRRLFGTAHRKEKGDPNM